jgi:23S rRNA (uracil1939-C5)-methyltransferase
MQVTVDHLGALGDGVVVAPAGRLHIPFTAPGDIAEVRVTGKDTAELVTLIEPGPDRAIPPCVHFGICGGCAVQHLTPEFTADWKRGKIVAALNRAGVTNVRVNETVSIPPHTRRRATLAAKRFGNRVRLGFTERASHNLVDLTECWVLVPELVAVIPPLRAALETLLNAGETADIALTLTETGIDMVLIHQRPLTLIDRETIAALAQAQNLACITWASGTGKQPEPVAADRMPRVRFSIHPVPLPPGSFIQPSIEGEAALTRLILEGLAGTAGPIVDLFCGIGTFTLPASTLGPITAYDGDRHAVAALKSATRGMYTMTIEQRDLFREPVTVAELAPFTAAIIDPPRAGAQAQARMLADSGITVIAAASCNPTTFARDAAILMEGGYRLERVTPVDQFLWSPHVELVGVFRRS